MSTQLSLMNLHAAGAHRGNHRSRLNPRLSKFVHSFDRNSMCVIDLPQTVASIEKACELLNKVGQRRRQVFVVGTSKYVKDYTLTLAGKFNPDLMPYVNNRWIGGTLTNWMTVKKTLKHLDKLENIKGNTEFYNKLSRNEQLGIDREHEKRLSLFGGLKPLKNNRPGAVIILDTNKNYNAILEAQHYNIPVIAITNVNSIVLPKSLDTTIVCNNTSLNTMELICGELADAYNAGYKANLETTENPANKAATTQTAKVTN